MKSWRGSAQSGGAGAVLVVLGAAWALVGIVLLALALLSADASALPDWISGIDAAEGAMPLTLLGMVGVAAGTGQVVCGTLVATGRAHASTVVTGLLFAAIGSVVVGLWLFGGLAQQRPAWILVLPLAAYLYVGWALAFGADWARPD